MVEQLRKTPLRPKIAILGSRQQYCVNPKVTKSDNRNDSCLELLAAKKCKHFDKVRQLVIRSQQASKITRTLFGDDT